uniref:BZIP domain-containing protein n=1 Tax=Ditylenchus dipsaci TaxID=166011 RepID=A0A915EG56_9BILA
MAAVSTDQQQQQPNPKKLSVLPVECSSSQNEHSQQQADPSLAPNDRRSHQTDFTTFTAHNSDIKQQNPFEALGSANQCFTTICSSQPPEPPSGYNNLGCDGSRGLVLVSSSQLAAAGTNLESFYSNASVSSSNYSDISLSPDYEEHRNGHDADGNRRTSTSDASTLLLKDESYWERRKRNNDAARKSREKRRLNDMAMEQRLVELTKENNLLKNRLQVHHQVKPQSESVIVAGPSMLLSADPPIQCIPSVKPEAKPLSTPMLVQCGSKDVGSIQSVGGRSAFSVPASNLEVELNPSQMDGFKQTSEENHIDMANKLPSVLPFLTAPRLFRTANLNVTTETINDAEGEKETPGTNEPAESSAGLAMPFSLSNLHAALQQHAAVMAINNQAYRSTLAGLPGGLVHPPFFHPIPPGNSATMNSSSSSNAGYLSAFQPFNVSDPQSSSGLFENSPFSSYQQPSTSSKEVREEASNSTHSEPSRKACKKDTSRATSKDCLAREPVLSGRHSSPDSSSDNNSGVAVKNVPPNKILKDSSQEPSLNPSNQPNSSVRPSVLSHIPLNGSPQQQNYNSYNNKTHILPGGSTNPPSEPSQRSTLLNPSFLHHIQLPQTSVDAHSSSVPPPSFAYRPSIFSNDSAARLAPQLTPLNNMINNNNQPGFWDAAPPTGSARQIGFAMAMPQPPTLDFSSNGMTRPVLLNEAGRSGSLMDLTVSDSQHTAPTSLLGSLLASTRRSPSVPESRTERQSGLIEPRVSGSTFLNRYDVNISTSSSSGIGSICNSSTTQKREGIGNKTKNDLKRRVGCLSNCLAVNLSTSSTSASASSSNGAKSDSEEHSLGSPHSTDSNRSRTSSLTNANANNLASNSQSTASAVSLNEFSSGGSGGIRRSSSPSNASYSDEVMLLSGAGDQLNNNNINTSASTSSNSPPSSTKNSEVLCMDLSGESGSKMDLGSGLRPDLERYMDRRRRNNEAAKRCRANRRAVFEYRSRRAQQLEMENGELRQEMLKLHSELEQLKSLIAANNRILTTPSG